MQFPGKDSGNGGTFVRLKDGDSVVGIFQGAPLDYRQHWSQAEGKGYVCPETKECPRCAKGEKSGFRFRLNMVISENGVYVAKIFEQGWTVYKSLDQLNKEYPLDKTVVKITRSGSDKSDTTYSIIPVRDQPSPEKLAEIARIELLNLSPEKPSHSDKFDEDVPF